MVWFVCVLNVGVCYVCTSTHSHYTHTHKHAYMCRPRGNLISGSITVGGEKSIGSNEGVREKNDTLIENSVGHRLINKHRKEKEIVRPRIRNNRDSRGLLMTVTLIL